MDTRGARQRGEVVLALLRRLRRRPVIACPSDPESTEQLFRRLDAPGHAAGLDDERYATILRTGPVAWKSVLAFLTQTPDGSTTRAFWMDPLRLTSFGCRLDHEDLETLAPLFGFNTPLSVGPAARIDHARLELSLRELDVGARFRLQDGRLGEISERYPSDVGRIAVCIDPDSAGASRILL